VDIGKGMNAREVVTELTWDPKAGKAIFAGLWVLTLEDTAIDYWIAEASGSVHTSSRERETLSV
jgi:hypothetical protein